MLRGPRPAHGAALALVLALAAACGDVAPTTDLPTGDPKVAYHVVDRGVPSETAQKVLDLVVRSAPQLKALRAKQEAAAGGAVHLNLSLLSGPDPEGANDLERTHHYVYVNTNGPSGLITTATFVVSADLSDVRVFDASGDQVVSVAAWAKELGAE